MKRTKLAIDLASFLFGLKKEKKEKEHKTTKKEIERFLKDIN